MLWDKIKELSSGAVATDCWNSYAEMIPKEKLIQIKPKHIP